MATNVDALDLARSLRQHFGRRVWDVPTGFGEDGWAVRTKDRTRSLIVTCHDEPDDGVEWVHASLTGVADVPSYAELKLLHRAVYGETGWAYQVFAPKTDHVNIHGRALHLFGRLDGKPALPDFTRGTGLI